MHIAFIDISNIFFFSYFPSIPLYSFLLSFFFFASSFFFEPNHSCMHAFTRRYIGILSFHLQTLREVEDKLMALGVWHSEWMSNFYALLNKIKRKATMACGIYIILNIEIFGMDKFRFNEFI